MCFSWTGRDRVRQELVVIRYGLSGDAESFWREMEKAAPLALRSLPGLVGKIEGLDCTNGTGLNTYLFQNTSHADAFLKEPILKKLRQHSTVAEVTADVAPVAPALSPLTGARSALMAATVS